MNKIILVIDDDPDILDALRYLLEDAEYEVITSEKGEYAENLTKGSKELPDLIVLDLLLSGKDGRSIAKTLKSDESTKKIPILMISAHPDAGRSARECGCDEFIAKPFDMDDLLNRVESLL